MLQRSQHEQLVEANQKLREYALASEKLAQSQERNRIARELHDTLAHTLSSVSVQLEAVKALFDINSSEAKSLLDKINHCLYRLVQEALENIIRHSNAKKVQLDLSIRHNEIHLQIQDDGT